MELDGYAASAEVGEGARQHVRLGVRRDDGASERIVSEVRACSHTDLQDTPVEIGEQLVPEVAEDEVLRGRVERVVERREDGMGMVARSKGSHGPARDRRRARIETHTKAKAWRMPASQPLLLTPRAMSAQSI